MRRGQLLEELEGELGVLVRRVRRVIAERARTVHPDLQPASYFVLTYLSPTGPCRSAALVEAFDIDKGAISRQVHHLVDLGLVEQRPDTADRRATLVSVTARATQRLALVAQQQRELLEVRLGDWAEADLQALVLSLGRYNADLAPMEQTVPTDE